MLEFDCVVNDNPVAFASKSTNPSIKAVFRHAANPAESSSIPTGELLPAGLDHLKYRFKSSAAIFTRIRCPSAPLTTSVKSTAFP